MRRFLSLFISAMLVLSMLSGCFGIGQQEPLPDLPDDYFEYDQQIQQTTPPTEPEKIGPESILDYTLDQEMIDLFYDQLQKAEDYAVAGTDLKAAEEAAEQLDEAYMAVISQRQIAYILYCMDQSIEDNKKRYMDCVDLLAEMESAYNAMCKRVYLSGTPLRDALFADWTQKDIDMLLAYNDEIARLEKRNTEITVEFRELNTDGWAENMVVLYNEMVRNNNRIADIYGYENFYVYAYDIIYKRDYGMESISLFRQYTSEYLAVAITEALEQFDSLYNPLDSEQKTILSSLSYSPYNEMQLNYAMLFVQDMPESSQRIMNDMFERERVVFATSNNAFEGAFTTVINDEPFCFFGPGYTVTESVVHELGHYYGISCTDYWNQPMDLSETQSQGNEWMYFYFLRKCVDPQLYQAFIEYQLLTGMSYILGFAMIDQFEEIVYSHPNAGNLTLEEYDAIMVQVAEDYGGIEMISRDVMDIQSYWKSVVLESPVYYISYGVSAISAINLFTMAEKDEAGAKEVYRRLMEEPLEGEGFLANITSAGLEGPFDESVYRHIYNRYVN